LPLRCAAFFFNGAARNMRISPMRYQSALTIAE
jgi:hypothetical protein